MTRPVLIVHGGAGPRRRPVDPERDAAVDAVLREAVDAGWAALRGGALAACVEAVVRLEDDPLFNAGRGAVLAADGQVYVDAAVMTGDHRAGAVCAIPRMRNPVRAAAALSRHESPVLWAGRPRELSAATGVPLVKASSLVTERQRRRLELRRAGHPTPGYGTVGAVCLDRDGGLAAATSTGGVMGQLPARVGDSPVIGAGTWADSRTCAVSATGDGEFFLRSAFASGVHGRMAFGGLPLAQAVREALQDVRELGGYGGAICVTPDGEIATPVSAEAMARAWRAGDDGEVRVELVR